MRIDERLQPHVTNRLAAVSAPLVTGIIGDAPSKYAKTPPLWNAVYAELEWDAVSVPWDVPAAALPAFVQTARELPALAGFNVTNPYKIAIVPLLDELDDLARHIGAVNTVVRQRDGRLVGYNTDGQGALDSLVATLPGSARPFLPSLTGRHVLMIGAGGAARAVAFAIAPQLGVAGALRIANRDAGKARDLAGAVRAAHGIGEGGDESQVAAWIRDTDLVINSSVKGQTGWRVLPDGSACLLEPYHALGPASPARIAAGRTLDAAAAHDWFAASHTDIAQNHAAAFDALSSLPAAAACLDLIYAPLETRFLADARVAGHATQNGKWMNIAQAADAFARRICAHALAERGIDAAAGYDRVFDIMARVW